MDIDKIVKQYKLMRVFRPILKFLEISILWIILPFIITILTSEKLKSDVPIILYVLIFLGYISLISIDGRDLDKYTPPAFLTERFFSKHMKKCGITELELEMHIITRQERKKEEKKENVI